MQVINVKINRILILSFAIFSSVFLCIKKTYPQSLFKVILIEARVSDVLFPSITVLAGSNTSLECNIYVNSIWDTVTLHQDSVNGSLLLAVYSSNGTATYPVGNKFVNVTFERNSDGMRVFLIITLQAASSCPSLLHFTCGITMADTFRSSFTNTSALSITGKPVQP